MALSTKLQFQKALLLLDQGDVGQGEIMLRDVLRIADQENDQILLTRTRCCLGELLLHLGRETEALPLLQAVVADSLDGDLGDLLDYERQRASELLGDFGQT